MAKASLYDCFGSKEELIRAEGGLQNEMMVGVHGKPAYVVVHKP